MERLETLGREDLYRRKRNARRVAECGAAIAILLSAIILIGWIGHARRLEAALPPIFYMKANSALGFGAAGIAMLALVRDRRGAATALAMLPLLIGILTLFEYWFGGRLSIDELLVRDWSSRVGHFPGRPPPNAASVLVAIGVTLIALAQRRSGRVWNTVIVFLCFAIYAVALEALAGHIVGSPIAISWGTGGRMSVPSIQCAFALATALLAYLGQSEASDVTKLATWVPLTLSFAIVLFDLCTPLEINAAICYVPLVLCALWFPRSDLAYVLAATSTLLIIFGFFTSPPAHIPMWMVILNRTLAVVAVWVVAALVHMQHSYAKRLRRSEQHLTTAQHIAAVGSFELSFSTMTFKSSREFDMLHGLAAQRRHAWDAFIRHAIPPDEREEIEQLIAAARGGMRPRDIDYSFLRADGVTRNAMLHCEVRYDRVGAPAGLIGVVHDVTELRQAQARQSDIESQLRHAQRLEALGMLAGGIAHDLNNTLVPITMLAPLLLETTEEPTGKQSLEIMIGAAQRAKDLVREMLEFSRKDEGGHEPIRIDRIAGDTLTIIRAGIPSSIAIVNALDPVPEIIGNKGQIYQIILNLATNAAHAIGNRGGTITIGSTCEKRAGVEDVRLYVTDDGGGMNETVRERIFEPFFSTKNKREGSGLGLSIVAGIIKSHGGSIQVQSEPGKGTRFDLLFPAVEASLAA